LVVRFILALPCYHRRAGSLQGELRVQGN
jgi:hypothetical protein